MKSISQVSTEIDLLSASPEHAPANRCRLGKELTEQH
jgi:hypothetical protein